MCQSSENIAALVPHKGQRHLISAAAIVRQQVPDAHLVILGEGELRETLERQIKHLNLEKHVLLVGFRPDALAYLKSFDIFVMSSLMEGLGTSVLDAMACARPVVATRAGGIPEVVTEAAATLVPPKDDQAMAREILALLDDPARRSPYGRGRPRARAGPLQRPADGARDARRLRGRGRQVPRSGHWESPWVRMKPHAFIIPR